MSARRAIASKNICDGQRRSISKDSPVNSLHDIGRDAALQLARGLSNAERLEVLRAMRLLNEGAATDSVHGAIVKLAVMFRLYPEVRELLASSAAPDA